MRPPRSARDVPLVILVLSALCLLAAGGARATANPEPAAATARWADAFADEADTVVFLAHGSLVRGSFASGGAGGDTLWSAPGGERLARAVTSPDRRHLAWLSRVSDRGVTTLWLWDSDGVRRRAGFMALTPSDIEVARYDESQPSIDDDDATGGRFASLGARTRSVCSNALVWDWSCDGVWFGFRDGIARAPVDTARVRVMSMALALELRRLDPAPMLYGEVVRLGEGRDAAMLEQWSDYGRDGSGLRDGTQDPYAPGSGGRRRVEPQIGSYLLYPGVDRLRAFHADGLHAADPWTASETAVWWVSHGKRLMTMAAEAPRETLVAEHDDPIVWLEWLATRHALARATGRTLLERAAGAGADQLRLATGSTIRAVLAAEGDPVRAIVTGDSLLLWDPRDDSMRGVALAGAAPTRMLDATGGARVFVSGDTKSETPRLDRLDPGAGALVSLEAPAIKKAVAVLSPSGRRVLLVVPVESGARVLRVGEVSGGGWREVAVPEGVLGWERVRP